MTKISHPKLLTIGSVCAVKCVILGVLKMCYFFISLQASILFWFYEHILILTYKNNNKKNVTSSITGVKVSVI